MPTRAVNLAAVPDFPLVRPDDDLGAILADALARAGLELRDGDIVVLAQKIVSKAEGRYVDLAQVVPSARAQTLAAEVDKDPRLVEVILSESQETLRHRPGLLIVVHRLGFVMANAGVDQSNVEQPGDGERVLLLPRDPDASCAALKAHLDERFGCDCGVIIADSAGRAWRNGVVGIALGAAGVPALLDQVGRPDLFGRALRITEVGLADGIAAAAALVMGEADEAQPAVLVRGLGWDAPPRPAAALLRPKDQDLFR